MDNTDIRKNVLESAFGLARAIRRGPGHMRFTLPPAVERTLMVISENDGISAGELCELLDMRPSSVSELSDRMSARGLVEKKADEADKRVSRIYLTDLGKAQAARVAEVRTEALNSFSACFTDEEAAQFCELAGKLAAHLNENSGDGPDGPCCGPHGGHHGNGTEGCGPHGGPHGHGHHGAAGCGHHGHGTEGCGHHGAHGHGHNGPEGCGHHRIHGKGHCLHRHAMGRF